MKKALRFFSGTIVCLALLSCNRDPLFPEPAPDALEITDISASFLPDINRIKVTWRGPDKAKFDYYRIYRAIVASDHRPDFIDYASTGARLQIHKDSTQFHDIPGLENTPHWYAILAFRKNQYGELSFGSVYYAPAPVEVATNVSFNINEGAIFTEVPECKLYVIDDLSVLEKVRFTQKRVRYLIKGDDRVEVPLADPFVPPPDSLFLAGLLPSPGRGFITTQGRVDPNVRDIEVPVFDADDPINSSREFPLSGSQEFPWVLPQGNGSKRVYAELTYKEVNGIRRIDTLRSSISIKPYRISMHLRNKTGGSDETMRVLIIPNQATWQFIYRPYVEFSVSIFADNSIEPNFHAWIITSQTSGNLQRSPSISHNNWLQTTPRKYELTGEGAAHDDEKVYTYSIDPKTPEGAANLQTLLADQITTPPLNNLAFPLLGFEPLNETCIPGSYLGPQPKHWNTTDRKIVDIQTAIPDAPEANYRRLTRLSYNQMIEAGNKEFTVIALFKGKYFGDNRVAVLGSQIKSAFEKRTTFDLYPPRASFDDKSQYWVTNDCTIVSNFTYALNNSPSVTDGGRSDIVEISLVIAKKEPEIPWNLTVGAGRNVTADTLSIQTVLGLRHQVFPYPIKVPSHVQSSVIWRDIDISTWPSGEYIMGIITSDRFGNRGWAPAGNEALPNTNPWKVTILTGR